MLVEVIAKFPLIKLRRKVTKERILAKHGDKFCIIYSETREKYKQGDEWVNDPDDAEVSTFRECYDSTKNLIKDGIVYCTLKI